MMKVAVAFVLFALTIHCSIGLYVFTGNPYTIGPLAVKHLVITKTFDDSPVHMSVYFPVQSGSYVPLIFISAFYGVIYSEMYSDVLVQLSSHGFIVIGIDLAWPAATVNSTTNRQTATDNRSQAEPVKIYKAIEWLRANLNQDTFVVSGNSDVKAIWTLLGGFSHSAGGDDVYRVVKGNHTLLKAVVFLEPFSFFFTNPLNYSVPTLSYGTEYSEEFPYCDVPKIDFRQFYKMLKCPRIELNVTMYGHCDILNYDFWEVCHLVHFCKTNRNNDRVFYRTFISGMLSSFFGTYLQGNEKLLQYVTNVDKIPISVGELQTDINCY